MKILAAALLSAMVLFGAAFEKSAKSGEVSAAYSSQKPLATGSNGFKIDLKQNGKPLSGAKVQMKVFMPEMPGMPYMEYTGDTKESSSGVYETLINFSMGGTWQVNILVETKDGKKYKLKSSVDL